MNMGALVLLITECRIRGKFPPDGLQPKGSATRVYPVQLNHNCAHIPLNNLPPIQFGESS